MLLVFAPQTSMTVIKSHVKMKERVPMEFTVTIAHVLQAIQAMTARQVSH